MPPRKPGAIQSNRTRSDSELKLSLLAMSLLVEAIRLTQVIAIGRKAEGLLQAMAVATAGAVRHRAGGGAIAFTEGLAALVKSEPIRSLKK